MKKPHIATLKEVIITLNGDYAEIDFRDPTVGGMSLKIGPEVVRLSDHEILHRFNETILAMQQSVASYEHLAVEVPHGSPQVSCESACKNDPSIA